MFRALCTRGCKRVLSGCAVSRMFSAAYGTRSETRIALGLGLPHRAQSVSFSSSSSSSSSHSSSVVAPSFKRTVRCGELGGLDASEGQEVQLSGWLESSRVMKKLWFGVLRDASGRAQFIMEFPEKKLHAEVLDTPIESVVHVRGFVRARPAKDVKDPADANEIVVQELRVINASRSELPITVRQATRVYEEAQENRFRYLDLRKTALQTMLRVRSLVTLETRMFLSLQRGFMEIETPLLQAKSGGGAEEFIVPSGKHHVDPESGTPSFYALPQSPQQHKQMLMAAGVEKYFQIAKCFRNEPARADRQPEFTQVDIEMAFIEDRVDVMELTEAWIKHVWGKLRDEGVCVTPADYDIAFGEVWPVLQYTDAMNSYGSDKPDLRWTSSQLIDVADAFGLDPAKHTVRAFNLKHAATKGVSDEILGELMTLEGKDAATRLLTIRMDDEDGDWKIGCGSPGHAATNALMDAPETIAPQLYDALDMQVGDVVVVGVGDGGVSEWRETCELLGRTRTWAGRHYSLIPTDASKFKFCWVVGFPLLEKNKSTKQLQSVHHPFSAPLTPLPALMDSDEDLLKVEANAYDLVLNGVEIGGGSIRIHDVEAQKRVLELLGLEGSCGHYLDMLSSGCPPHGGIAFGLDRLLSIILSDSREPLRLRDVIPFPKTQAGKDLAINAPGPVNAAELKDVYSLKQA
jgi:aspartyl-tRNA synthetase